MRVIFVLLVALWVGIVCPLRGAEVLVFSKTAGFRHASIANGLAAIQQLAATNNLVVTATEDAAAFTDANLARFVAVVFLSTTGDVLATNQQAAFERYIRAGGGYAGVHSASDTEYSWPWYGGLVGAFFSNHPAIQTATVRVEDFAHVSSQFLPAAWVRNDEWYNFRSNPRGNVRVLARLDETTYSGGTMGDHPIAWYHRYDGGRAWYTAGGHTAASYSEPLFRAHLLGGIRYAAGLVPAPEATVVPTTFVTPGSVWKYLDDGSDQGTAWHGTNFDDSAWASGPAQLGYGDGDEATVVRSNRGDGSRIITTYFRRWFTVPNRWALTNLTVNLIRDDGGIVYLNGVEIFRSNMANGPVDYLTRAMAAANSEESTFFPTNVPLNLLRAWTNLLAVEIHQSSTTSSDISFDLHLGGDEFDRPPELALTRSGETLIATWPAWAGTAVLEGATNLAESSVWSPLTNTDILTNDLRRATLPTGPDRIRFLRLRLE